MKRIVPYILIAWIPFTAELFVLLTEYRAILAAFLLGWMFLPVAPYPIAGTPGFAKIAAICLSALLGIALVDLRRIRSLRLIWVDVPVLLFCLSPFASALVNSLGAREGFSAVFCQTVTWGIPYVIGRLYFKDLHRLSELATAVFAAGVIYAPLALFEVWKGPQLNRLVYGFHQTASVRPRVFMDNDLMVAFWFAAATVLGFWLWRSGARQSIAGIPLAYLLPVPVIASILEGCVNGWVLIVLGIGLLVVCCGFRNAVPVLCVALLIIVHMAVRGSGLWSGNQAVSAVALVSRTKAQSVAYRFRNENVIAGNARERPILGWGRQPKVLYDDRTGESAVCDGLWMLMFAEFGAVGVIGLTASLLLPVVLFIRRFPVVQWSHPAVAPAAALAVVLVLYMTDHLANAMINPVYMLAAGGLTGISCDVPRELADKMMRFDAQSHPDESV